MSDMSEIKTAIGAVEKVVTELREKAADKADLADVVRAEEVKRIQEELGARLTAEQEARRAMEVKLADIETAQARPGNGGGAPAVTEEQKAFDRYLRRGDETGFDTKAMQTNVGESGGFALPQPMEAGIRDRMRRWSPLRGLASVVSIQGASYDVLVERGDAGFEWAGETSARGDTATPTINRISIAKHELSALPKVSQRALDDMEFDLEAWLIGRITTRFARGEGAAFVAGDGVDKPKGIVSYATAVTADAARAAETLQHRLSGANGAFAASKPADVIVKTFYDLQGVYQANASWGMNSRTAAEVAVLQDGDGAYLLQGMMNGDGQFVRTIMGRRMELLDDMPDLDTGSLSIAVGDFEAGYTIVEGPAIRVLRDPFSAKPNVIFYATKRVGGGVTDFDAIKLIKFANS